MDTYFGKYLASLQQENEVILKDGLVVGGNAAPEPDQPMDLVCVVVDGACDPHSVCTRNIFCLPDTRCLHDFILCNKAHDPKSVIICY